MIFKESRFSIGAYSRRGATGLMQVMRSTAAVYGITDLFRPEENIKAGTMHLRHIERRYQNMGFDSINVVKFTSRRTMPGRAGSRTASTLPSTRAATSLTGRQWRRPFR